MKFIISLLLFLFAFTFSVVANNVSVSNVTLTGQNTGASPAYTLVQFDITWDNSWRDIVNWDAGWVFVKYSTDNGNNWYHATLATSGHTAPTGSTITASSDGKGIFIYRSSTGSGTNSFTSTQLKWNYGTDGVSNTATVKIKVFAIEMVYIPGGNFYVGDGSNVSSGDYPFFNAGTNNPLLISSEAAITLGGTAAGNLGANNNADFNSSTTQTLPADFPKGYTAFYCMKYEISQEQYADFLNTITSSQASNRYSASNNGSERFSISGSHPNYSSSKPYVACNYIGWTDGCAYADWACLRPITELEYEKACRGDVFPVAGEHAWGTTSYTSITTISNDGASNEVPSSSSANVHFGGSVSGPIRCGAFATSTSTREQAGASYYGVMELSGNVSEQCVTVGNSGGRSFTGTHGNGTLTSDGFADNSDWPGYSSTKVSGFNSIPRGGYWTLNDVISERSTSIDTSNNRSLVSGFRGVRTAP